jgi:hypothetical protein
MAPWPQGRGLEALHSQVDGRQTVLGCHLNRSPAERRQGKARQLQRSGWRVWWTQSPSVRWWRHASLLGAMGSSSQIEAKRREK